MKYLFIITIVLLLPGCGLDDTVMKIANDKGAVTAMSVARANRCTNCHAVSTSIIGPAWNLVSDRYKEMPRDKARSWLIEKVKNGGSGSWNSITGGAEMPAQGRIVSQQHIEVLVDFILSLKRDENAQGQPLSSRP